MKIGHKPGYFPIHHSYGGAIIFLSMGQKYYFQELEIQHDISLLRLMYKLYFKIITF